MHPALCVLLDHNVNSGALSPADRDLIARCFSTRGKRRGLILSSAPSGDDQRRAAWEAAMWNLAPARCSIYWRMCAPVDDKATFDRIDAWLSPHRHLLCAVGQRELEFNVWHYHHKAADVVAEYRREGTHARDIGVVFSSGAVRSCGPFASTS